MSFWNMDLYADLPPAKGDANAAARDDKSSAPSVWAKGVPPFVPAAASAKRNAPTVKTATSMLPASLAGARKSPDAAAARNAASRGGISLAFRPASVRKTQPASSGTSASIAFKPSVFNPETATQRESSAGIGKPTGVDTLAGATTGLGFVAATTWTEVTVSQGPAAEQAATVGVADATSNTHFFQASYRDEYHPSRPNNYEAFCEERTAKRKMEQVKRDLEKRQRDQDIESKREREQFVKDVNAGKAPSLAMPLSAGRGRGMTVPAWMKKKIEESASKGAPQADTSASVTAGVDEDQFEDAAPRMGLGFSVGGQSSARAQVPHKSTRDEFGREVVSREDDRHSRDRSSRRRSRSRSPNRSRRSQDRPSQSSREREPRSSGRFDVTDRRDQPLSLPRTGRVVLLQNMVGPGEVDDELQEEVKEECSSKYGPVTKCLVYEIRGHANPEEAVRIFVEFQHQAHADLAQKGLNSRFFGGRRVKATYYDEAKFARLELGA